MRGNLENTNLTDVFLNLFLTRRSGILRIWQSDVKKSIYFLEGAVVFAHSNQKYDRLGETLLRLGKITLEEFEIASRDVIEKGKRLGQSLSDLGFISAQEVNSSVHYQLQQITHSLFDWDSGEFEFVDRDRPVFEDIMIDVSTPSLIFDGIRNITNLVVLERSYQKYENQALHLNQGVPLLPRTDLDFSEETILACVDGTRTIEAVRQLAHLSAIEFARALYSLLVSGILQFEKDEKDSKQAEERTAARAAGVHARFEQRRSFTTQSMEDSLQEQDSGNWKTLSEDELRRLIALTGQKFQDASDEEVLNVLPGCTLKEIDKAYEDLTAQFHPPYNSQNRFLDLKDPLKAILDRLTEAHDNLIAKVHSHLPLSETPLDLLSAYPPAISESSEVKPLKMERDSPPVASLKEQPLGPEPQKEPISELQDRIRRDPGNTILLRRLGKRFYETGKPHEGEKQLLRALEIEPQSVENHFALADFYNSLGLRIKAFKHLNIILQLQPNNERAMEMLNLKKGRKPLYEIEH